MSAGICSRGCDCEQCVDTVSGDCGCFTGVGDYHQSAPRIETTYLDAITEGVPFTETLVATGARPMAWSVIVYHGSAAGLYEALKDWRSPDGELSFTAPVSGNYSMKVRAENAYGNDEQEYTGWITEGTTQ